MTLLTRSRQENTVTSCCPPRLIVRPDDDAAFARLLIELDESCLGHAAAVDGGTQNSEPFTPCGHDVQGTSS